MRARRRTRSLAPTVLVLALVSGLVAGACTSSRGPDSAGTGSTIPVASTVTTSAPIEGALVVNGTASVDGVPFDAEFLGAVVRDAGLETSCQFDLAAVTNGDYRVTVFGEQDSLGCGRIGADVVVWTYVGDQRLFSTSATPWSADAATVTFDAEFSTASPGGAMRPATELAGEVYEPSGHRLEAGRRVEAFVDDTLCGVSTTRQSGDFVGFALAVVGPDSIPGCTSNGPIAFRVDGRPANETLANDGSLHRSFDLTVS